MSLEIDPDELNACVGCGLCLPHCPTYRVTGDEALSPRGRIDSMRRIEWAGGEVDDDFVDFMSTCVQCRGCEPACPSQVPYGRLIEATRQTLATARRITPWWQRLGLSMLHRHRLVMVASTMGALASRARLVPRRFGLTAAPVRRGPAVVATAGPDDCDVWLFIGCVMDAWFRGTHRSTAAVLDSMGVRYSVPGSGGGCCGALQSHAGLADDARARARAVIRSMPGSSPILVNSAGCGAALKEYGHLLGTAEAREFSSRVLDVHEWLADRDELLPDTVFRDEPVIVQDPCHLRHVQRVHDDVRAVLRRCTTLVELDDDGLCCGAGGAYSVIEPDLASSIRERKIAAIDRAVAASGSRTVVSANPGCSMHLAPDLDRRGIRVVHPVDLLAEALR